MPHLEERCDSKMTIGRNFVWQLYPKAMHRDVAGAKKEAVPALFLELPVGTEKSIYSRVSI